jgi:hypothetical protein
VQLEFNATPSAPVEAADAQAAPAAPEAGSAAFDEVAIEPSVEAVDDEAEPHEVVALEESADTEDRAGDADEVPGDIDVTSRDAGGEDSAAVDAPPRDADGAPRGARSEDAEVGDRELGAAGLVAYSDVAPARRDPQD